MDNEFDDIKKSIDNIGDININIQLPIKKSHIKRNYSYLISGIVCVLAASVLFTIILLNISHANATRNFFWLCFFVIVIALICLTKGVFTLCYHCASAKYDQTIYSFILSDTYNRLLLTYERVLWLWVLCPIIIVVSIYFAKKDSSTCNIYTIDFFVVLLYSISLFFPSKRLWKKIRYLKNEIKRLKNVLKNG